MTERVAFNRGVGLSQNGMPTPLPEDIKNDLIQEAAKLSDQIEQEGLSGSAGSYVGDGVAIYQTILDWIDRAIGPGASSTSYTVDSDVYTWLTGAIGVNSNTSFQGHFIQNYTIDSYSIRFEQDGGDTSNIENIAQTASNQIALSVADDIIANNDLPDAAGLSILDAGAAASRVFDADPILDPGDYSGWAGTLLFPYLGQPNVYNYFLLDPNSLTLPGPTGSAIQQPATVTYKHIDGTYDLFASIESSGQATTQTGLQVFEDQLNGDFMPAAEGIDVKIRGVRGVSHPDQTSLINSTDDWVTAFYSLSSKQTNFLPNQDLVFSQHITQLNNYVVGTLTGEVLDESTRLGKSTTIIVGGPGDDTITGTTGVTDPSVGSFEGGDLIDGGDGNNTIYAGSTNDIIFGGGSGDNTIYGNKVVGAKTTDTLIGIGGDAVAADATLGFTDKPTPTNGHDTIYSGEDRNILIGGQGTNTFNVDPSKVSASAAGADGAPVNIIWGNDGKNTYSLTNAAASGTVYIVYINDPTVKQIADLDVDKFVKSVTGSASVSSATTIIINPSKGDALTINGKPLSDIIKKYSVWDGHNNLFLQPSVAQSSFYDPTGGLVLAGGPGQPSDIQFTGSNPDIPTSDPNDHLEIQGLTDGVLGVHVAGVDPYGQQQYVPVLSTVKIAVDPTSAENAPAPSAGGNELSGSDDTTYTLPAGQSVQTINNTISATATAGGTVVFGLGMQASDLSITAAGPGSSDVQLAADGTMVTLTDELGSSTVAPITKVVFADGTSLSYSDILAAVETPSAANKAIYGDAGSNVLDSKGLATYAQGGGGGDTFIYNQGYGQLEINENDPAPNPANVLILGPGITSAQLAMSYDASGNLYLTDGMPGDQIKIDQQLSGSSYGVQSIVFADGTTLSTAGLDPASLVLQADTGTTGADELYAAAGPVTFDGKGAPAGTQDYEQGSGGADTFIFNQGYGQLEISEAGIGANPVGSVLQLGAGISMAQVQVAADSSGDVILTDGTPGDQIKLDSYLDGPSYGPQTVSFADGSSWTQAQVIAQLTTGTAGGDILRGSAGADTFDGKGAPGGSQDYEQGNGGADTFIFNQGYGQLEISEVCSSDDASVLQFGAGISAAQLQVTTDGSGNVFLTDGIAGDRVMLDDYMNGSAYGPHSISFDDGTSWTQAQVLAQLTTGTAGADTLFGSTGADVFDGKGAPAGSQDYEQGNGGNDTFIYDQGYGQLEINAYAAAGDGSTLQLGAGITSAQIQVTTDSSGNAYLSDGTPGDQVELDGYLYGPSYGPQTIAFADGSTWTQAQLLAAATTGTAGADSLYGTSGADVFDGKGAPAGAQDYEQGNGGADTFIYNQGYGQLEINEQGPSSDASVLAFGPGISAANLVVTADGSGDVILTDGVAGDQVTLDNYLTDPSYGPQKISFADGTTWTQSQIIAQTTAGTSGADTLYGSFGAETFDGKGAPSGSQDYEQGNGGNDTFIYNQGYGQLEINEAGTDGDASVLQFGPGITAEQVQVTTDGSGNVFLADGIAGDQIKLDSYLNSLQFGPQTVSFADGTSWTKAEIIAQLTTGTAGADMLYGSVGGDTFDGKGAPAGSQDYEQGNGGADTFIYNQGYGQLEINEQGSSSDASVLQLGPGITAAQVQVTADRSGDLILTDGIAGDQITLDSYFFGSSYGPQTISFADGTSWTQAQAIALADTLTTGADIYYGVPDANSDTNNIVDGQGAPAGSEDYENNGGGTDTFVYNQGYGHLEIYDVYGRGGTLLLGPGITMEQLQATADTSGNLYLTDGISGDQVELDGYLNGSFYGPQTIAFADGTSWTQAQLIALTTIGTAGADKLYGTSGADTFDGKGAPAGSEDYEQGNGGADTFIYNQGYGRLEINEATGYANTTAVLQLGASITFTQINVSSDASGDIILTDGTPGDQVNITGMANLGYNGAAQYGVATIEFADGSAVTRQQVLNLLTTGSAAADRLYGTSGADVFDGKGAPSGSQDYEQGNGGADTFVYNQGYGTLEIDENAGYYNTTAVLQLGAGITQPQVTATSDRFGNLTLYDGTAGDQVTIDGQMHVNFYGGSALGVAQVLFADGTTLNSQQLRSLATTGTTGADTLYGTVGADTFDGNGAPAGAQDYEQGNGGNDTFIYNQGYGKLEINEQGFFGDASVLQLGTGITAAQMQVTTDALGDVLLSDGTEGDQIQLDGYTYGSAYGPQIINFADGTTWTQEQTLAYASTIHVTGNGGDTVYVGGNNAVVVLNNDNNFVTGSSQTGADGADGNVSVSGGSGATTVQLGNGQDNVTLGGLDNDVELGNGSDTVDAGSGGATITLGSGNNQVTLSGASNTVAAGDGNDTVTGGAYSNSVALGGGTNTITLAGEANVVTVGNGQNTITLQGAGNTVTLGDGTDTVNAGNGDTITLNSTTLSLSGGTGETVFLGSGASSVTDVSSNTMFVASAGSGNSSISGFASDAGALLDLQGGVGGYSTATSIVDSLTGDGQGGTLLILGGNSASASIDFLNTSLSALTVDHFRVG